MSSQPADLRLLTRLVARLRGPDGCPWDRRQTLGDVRAYLLEEAHELAAAMDGEDWEELAEELGDLLFQAAFVARLGEESRGLDLARVLQRTHRKMIERHPHVFGDESLEDAAAVARAWEERKLAGRPSGESLLAGVARSLPALVAAYRMTQKAAGVGFDWSGPEEVLAKVEEELEEVRSELEGREPGRRARLEEELGDLLFAVANLARHLEVDPEAALAKANRKFRRRFRHLESRLAEEGGRLATASLETMERFWSEAKERQGQEEREAPGRPTPRPPGGAE